MKPPIIQPESGAVGTTGERRSPAEGEREGKVESGTAPPDNSIKPPKARLQLGPKEVSVAQAVEDKVDDHTVRSVLIVAF